MPARRTDNASPGQDDAAGSAPEAAQSPPSRQWLLSGWFWTAVGGVAGIAVAPPQPLATMASASIGAGLGLGVDRWLRGNVASAHLRLTFVGLGYVAKAHGQVHAAHIDHAETLMRRLHFTNDERRTAIRWFNVGKHGPTQLARLARWCDLAPARPQLKQVAVTCILESVTLLGHPPPAVVDAAHAVLRALRVTHQLALPPRPLDVAYDTLGLAHDANVDAVKLGYRRLVKRYHPDTMPGASGADLANAEARMHAFREAYELILANIEL